jgi:hypothetical protein
MSDDADDLDEDIVTNKLLDERGLPPTDANIERVQRTPAFTYRMLQTRFAAIGAPVAESLREFRREMRRRGCASR